VEYKHNFFDNVLIKKHTLQIAKELIGSYLIVESPEGATIGKIVETEAYLWNDKASHSFSGETKRNSAMFKRAGTIYIYFIYGNHYCFNIVTNKEGKGEAVLIRALEPIKGTELMKMRRKVEKIGKLCSGPGNLTKAMGINKYDNLSRINEGRISILKDRLEYAGDMGESRRVGVSKDSHKKYRFYLKDNNFVSRSVNIAKPLGFVRPKKQA